MDHDTEHDAAQTAGGEWGRFERRLAAYLSTMDDHEGADELLLELAGSSTTYAHITAGDSGTTVSADVAGDDFGTWPLKKARRLAGEVCASLRVDFAIPHPQLLTVIAGGPASVGVGVLGLESSDGVPADIVDITPLPPKPIPELIKAKDVDQMMRWVGRVLAEWLEEDEPPVIDDDGDFMVLHGEGVFWVRVRPEQPVIEIFARVVDGVYSRRATAVEIGLLNRDQLWTRWVLRDRSIWLSCLVPAGPFVPMHLTGMLGVFVHCLDSCRDDLALRTRGRVA